MAKALNIPEHHPLLEEILKDLESDMDWDDDNTIASIYKKKGLKRYKLEGVKGFKERNKVDKVKETFSATTGGPASSSMGPLLQAAGSSMDQAKIKIENPLYQELQQQLNVVKSGKTQLEKLYSQALDLKVVLQQKACEDPLFDAKLKEYGKSCDCLDSFLQQLRVFLYKSEALDQSCDSKLIIGEATSLVDSCMAHCDGIKSLMKRSKALF